MTLAHAINKALAGAEVLRQKSTSAIGNAEVALLIEQCTAIEHVCEVARKHLKPAPPSEIAEAILDSALAMLAQVREFEIKSIAQKGTRQ
jgi:hypothetical protein